MPQQGKVDISNLYPGLDPWQMDQAHENLDEWLGNSLSHQRTTTERRYKL
jgi:hypothetical protein